jgi:hypothetical protein
MPTEIVKNEDGIYWDNTKISFFRKTNDQVDYLSPDEVECIKTDCGWECHISNSLKDTVLGIMIPVNDFELLVHDQPTDLYKSKRYYFNPEHELERLLKLKLKDLNEIGSPIVHFMGKDRVFSWSCPNECVISTFVNQYKWYINIEAHAWENLVFYLDESSNYLINLQRFPSVRKTVLMNETVSMDTIKRSLLAGHTPTRELKNPANVLQQAREIQAELTKFEIDSALIGSLARRLNSIAVNINDIDLMVENKEQLYRANSALGAFSDFVSITDNGARLKFKNTIVEICYDNYNILRGKNYLVQKHGLTYVDAEGLLWLYMINLFACNIDEHSDDYKNQIINALASLSQAQEIREFGVVPYAKEIPHYSSECFKLCEQLSTSIMKYFDIRINKPFTIRCFQNDSGYLFPIVNLGSQCDAEVVINFVPQIAIWKDISGQQLPIKVNPYQDFSVLHIPKVELPGVLECSTV